jgi:Phage integrase, N-terminal SAM-like domain
VTVAAAFDAYWAHRALHKAKGIASDQAVVKAHILPVFGETEVRKLTRTQIEDWLNARATAPKRKRTAKGDTQTFEPPPLPEEEKRARKVSANRLLAVLKAASIWRSTGVPA